MAAMLACPHIYSFTYMIVEIFNIEFQNSVEFFKLGTSFNFSPCAP